MTRYYDWQTKLREFIESRTFAPFAFGVNDCCLFACDAIAAITGVDMAAEIRGYTTEAEADAVLAQWGGVEGVAAAMCEKHGAPEIPASFAQRGDVVLCHLATGDTLTIVDTGGRLVGPGRDGLVSVPRKTMRRAWRIG